MEHNENALVKLEVAGVVRNHASNGFYSVVLKETDGDRTVQIVIGMAEAHAIECVLKGIVPPRPLTHDLICMMMQSFHIEIDAIIIEMLPDGIYAAKILATNGTLNVTLDGRSSDAVAIAVRLSSPIYMPTHLLDAIGQKPVHLGKKKKTAEKDENTAADFSAMTDEQLRARLKEAAADERYEVASMIKMELKNRQKNNISDNQENNSNQSDHHEK